MTLAKICGIKSAADGRTALEAGADMLGFVFYKPVPRYVEPELVRKIVNELRQDTPHWLAVGVFVDEANEQVNAIADGCGLDMVQLAGEESPPYCASIERPVIKVLRIQDGRWGAARLTDATAGYDVERFMVDSHVSGFYGGTGVASDWESLTGLLDEHILAGGLRPENVARAISATRPWAVDVSTGVETAGRKDPELIRDFMQAVRCSSPTRVGEGR